MNIKPFSCYIPTSTNRHGWSPGWKASVGKSLKRQLVTHIRKHPSKGWALQTPTLRVH